MYIIRQLRGAFNRSIPTKKSFSGCLHARQKNPPVLGLSKTGG
jgi:hypothetical protein